MVKHFSIILIVSVFTSWGCSTKKSEVINDKGDQVLSDRDRLRLKHYIIEGRRLYIQHCSNCHQEDGSGLGKLIPPLVNSDFIQQDAKAIACIIKNGIKGEIIVNGIDYNQEMPGHNELTDLEIAEIMTFISNEWNDGKEIIGVKEINDLLDNCVDNQAIQDDNQ